MRKFFIASIFILTFCAFAFGQNSNCPIISVTGPPGVLQSGETATFTASVSDESENPKLQFVWSVNSGKIIEGQGTQTITIGEIPFDSSPTATVEIKGLPEGCENTDSETAMTGCLGPSAILFDESEISSQHLSSEKLNTLISELENNPNDSIYFIIYPHKKDPPDELKNEENYIRNYLIANKIEPDRLVFVTTDSDESESGKSRIRIFRVPQGAVPPTP